MWYFLRRLEDLFASRVLVGALLWRLGQGAVYCTTLFYSLLPVAEATFDEIRGYLRASELVSAR